MKNNARIRSKHCANPPFPQGQTTLNPMAAAAPVPEPGIDNGLFSHDGPACLLLFDTKHDTTLAGVDITAAKLLALRRRAAASGQSVAALLSAGLDYALRPAFAGRSEVVS